MKGLLVVEALPAAAAMWGMLMHAMSNIKVTVTVERRR